MNKVHSINPYSFKGASNYTVYGKQNKQIHYLYNQVVDVVKENKVPATFFMGPEDKIVLSPQTKQAKTLVSEALNKLGIKFSKEVEK